MASACRIPNLNTDSYSSPVPFIGLYIATGSVVCFLLMLLDIMSAYRQRKSWIPCRFFQLNSFTLTLLAISSKLQVDLTTVMPGVPDQFAKLTGTALLCICMGFLNLSVGNNGNSEYLSNMTALSIMIITVVVNICIQLSTGAIFLFIPEHIITICCMLIVLLLMWHCARETELRNPSDEYYVLRRISSFTPMDENVVLLRRLKACYALGFDKNPQSRACGHAGNLLLVQFCFVCFWVLAQAMVRSALLKQLLSCRGASDYEWSTWFILVTQILTVFLGCSALCFRWFTSFSFLYLGSNIEDFVGKDWSMKEKFFSTIGTHSCYKLGIYLLTSLYFVVHFLSILILIPSTLLFISFGGKMEDKDDQDFSTSVKEFIKDQISVYYYYNSHFYNYPCNRTMEKVMDDVNSCVEESKRGHPKELLKLISRTRPSPNFTPIDETASPLPLAALVKIAITCLPEGVTETLVLCFHEAIDILQAVVDTKDMEYEFFMKDPLLVREWFEKGFRIACEKYPVDTSSCYHKSVENFLTEMSKHHNLQVVARILEQKHETLEGLYCVIEQLFVDLLHSAFTELPNVIFRIATECPMEIYKERLRPVVVALHKIAPLEGYIKWSFPEKSGILSLITPPSQEVVATENQNNQREEDRDASTSSHPMEGDVTGVRFSSNSTHHHVTLEIEEL